MKKTVFLFAIAMLIGAVVPKDASAQTYWGTWSCSEWMHRSKQKEIQYIMQSWVTGFLSGVNLINVVVVKKRDALSKFTQQQAFDWLDNYCKDKPLEDLAFAVLMLSSAMENKK